MSAEGHGLPDASVKEAHDFIHHAEQEEHEHEAAERRGLPDSAAEAEHEFMDSVEGSMGKKSSGSKVKRTIEKLIPGKH
ncbi:hypothetical protein F4780DRAFT_633983 [Xylariomycetidae sp. FL0641]|nr:hypothetical protein F4780DRAFT_633983 [Xylariomycetidae sp. FL0641]